MAYTYEWPRAAVTVDAIVLSAREPREVLLIERGQAPFEGRWALPGGFLDMEEELEAGARRELAEETGVALPGVAFRQLGAYGSPGRDPRGRTISVVYVAIAPDPLPVPVARDDAAAARWWPVAALPPLAFDHGRVVADALARLPWPPLCDSDPGRAPRDPRPE